MGDVRIPHEKDNGYTFRAATRDDFTIAEYVDFSHNIEKQEIKRNLMSGKEFTQSVNTPLCCDPSSETYWSM